MDARQYDYIFLGAGLASLSIVMRLLKTPGLQDKKILLLDKELKNRNDRTWCFWQQTPGAFEEIIFKRWHNLEFRSQTRSTDLDIAPYNYNMIRGIDFYDHCFRKISEFPNVSFVQGDVSLDETCQRIFIQGDPLTHGSDALIFNSIITSLPRKRRGYHLLQHFKGYLIKSQEAVFEPDRAILMDFSANQQHGTSFYYVLPISPHSALVEFTLFTEDLLAQKTYDKALDDYLSDFPNLGEYQVAETEFGVIPMTNAAFPLKTGVMYNIGTAGGQTKPSTGYTFSFVQKQAEKMVSQLANGFSPDKILETPPARFNFYDSTFLRVLTQNKVAGRKVFTTLFEKNKASRIFKFLDNESSVREELGILSSLPFWPFFKAGVHELLN